MPEMEESVLASAEAEAEAVLADLQEAASPFFEEASAKDRFAEAFVETLAVSFPF
jgi:hypothetical protein